MLATLIRLLRPSHGLHAAPRALRREVREEARAARVRRYANPLPARPAGPGYASMLPAPTGHTSVVRPDAVNPPVDLVRGYYRAYEAQQRHTRADRGRSELFVLCEAATLEGAA